MASKTFFVSLKETCRKIDNDVSDIKAKLLMSQEDHEKEEAASKKICEIQDKITSMKTDASALKNMLGPELAHTRDFIKNFKELMAETEVSISKKEEYLKQYGYVPVKSVPEVPDIQPESHVTPDKKIKDLPKTPTLLDYGVSSYTLATTPEFNQKSSIENSAVPSASVESSKPMKSRFHTDLTPTLDVAAIISTKKSEETPPFPEPLYTPAKETTPNLDLAPHLGNFPSTPKFPF